MAIKIYTDASLVGDPAEMNGGYAYSINGVVFNEHVSANDTNYLEMIAVIRALGRVLPTKQVVYIYSDSAYIVETINDSWYEIWEENGWKNKKGEPIKFLDEWKFLIYMITYNNVHFIKVPAHTGNFNNEICDKKAKEAAVQSLTLEKQRKFFSNQKKKKKWRKYGYLRNNK